MPPRPDPYRVLKVMPDASQAEIKSAYRRLAKAYHPDLNQNDPIVEDKFREVQTAYEILRDKERRGLFDRGGLNNMRPSSRTDTRFDDLWSMFGSSHTKQAARQTNLDIWHSVTVPFNQAIQGGKKTITLANRRTLAITIPPGSRDGVRLRLKGQGVEKFGDKGDLFVVLQVLDDPRYRIIGDDIHMEVFIPLKRAVLGGQVKIETLHGRVAVKLKPGTNSGMRLRLKGKGIPGKHGHGDCYARLSVKIPEPIPNALKMFVEKLEDE